MKIKRGIPLIILAALSVAFLQFDNTSVATESEHILFSSDRNSDGRNIFSMDEKGKSITQLTNNAIRGDNMVSLSPNKEKLLFTTYRFGGWKLGVSEKSGSNIRRLTSERGYETSASWSSDGSKVVFSKINGPGQGYTKIFIFNLDTKEVRQLTNARFHHVKPSFSPDDSKIIFEQYDYRSSGSSVGDILQLDLKTLEIIELTKNEKDLAFAPAYSPSGQDVSYLSVDGKKNVSIKILNLENNTISTLANDIGRYPGGEEQFFMRTSWNSDGDKIVFSVYDGRDYEISVINTTTGQLTQLTSNSHDDVQPFWIH